MFSLRYARALLNQRASLMGSHAALARQVGLSYKHYMKLRAGGHKDQPRPRLGYRLEQFLGVRPVTIYVPVGMSDVEIDRRLALARKGSA